MCNRLPFTVVEQNSHSCQHHHVKGVWSIEWGCFHIMTPYNAASLPFTFSSGSPVLCVMKYKLQIAVQLWCLQVLVWGNIFNPSKVKVIPCRRWTVRDQLLITVLHWSFTTQKCFFYESFPAVHLHSFFSRHFYPNLIFIKHSLQIAFSI